jgi:hypothetical protein
MTLWSKCSIRDLNGFEITFGQNKSEQ